MNNIILKESNRDRINKEIKKAEGRATARLITYDNMIYICEEVEALLDIAKNNMNGVKIDADYNAQRFPTAYKYTPESTHFTAEYKGNSWTITDIYRDRCRNGIKKADIILTDKAKTAIIDKCTQI